MHATALLHYDRESLGDSLLILQQTQPCPRFSFRAKCKRPVSRINMRECGVLVRRKFRARSALAPQIVNFFFVRRSLLCAIARWARTLQDCEFGIDFFIELLYRLVIPRMRVPPLLEKAETRYFVSKLSCQRRLNGEAKTIGDDPWLGRP